MKIEVLRLTHRKNRDIRVSTHCCLVSRAFGVSKIYYTGDKDEGLEKTVKNVNGNWGSKFSVEYVGESLNNTLRLISLKKKQGFRIIHLTMYGLEFEKSVKLLKKLKKLFIVVGSEKVDSEIYKIADYNLSVANQPHSEIAALAVFVYDLNNRKFVKIKGKIKIKPSNRLKIVENN